MSAWDQIRIVPGKHQAIGYERIEPEHGEVDFRVVSDRGYETIPLPECGARYWAAELTRNYAGLDPAAHSQNGATFRVQSRIVGVTDWADSQSPKTGGEG
jgi:hypothetical protein